jgi:UDP-glucuronate decarboxylase
MKILLDGEKPNVYNVGNPKPEISMLRLAQTIAENIDKSIDVEIVNYPSTYPQDEPNRRCPDISRIQRNLQYDPKIELLEGLARFFAWAKLNYLSEFF